MSKPTNISSLSALRERKAELAAEAITARQGLTSTLAKTPATAKEYALEDLAIPALGMGLAIYVGYRLLRPKRKQLPLSYAQPAYEAPVFAQLPYVHAKETVETDSPQRQRITSPQPQAPTATNKPGAAKGGFNFSNIMTVGKILVPAVQAVVGIVQNQQLDQVEQSVKQTKEEVASEV
jgi:hypothetical protein